MENKQSVESERTRAQMNYMELCHNQVTWLPVLVFLTSTGWISPTTKTCSMLTSGSLLKTLGLAWCWKCLWFHQFPEAP